MLHRTWVHLNQFLLNGDEPFLFHCGMRQLYPLVSAAIAKVIPLEQLRWISFAHIEADECGSMNMLLAAAPHAQVIHGPLACMLSLTDMCDRPPVPVGTEPGDTHDIGGHRLRFIATPHVPHNWESGLWFDETTSTLLAGDLLTHTGRMSRADRLRLRSTGIGGRIAVPCNRADHQSGARVEQLAQLTPTTLALMHGASFTGDGTGQLRGLADGYAAMAG